MRQAVSLRQRSVRFRGVNAGFGIVEMHHELAGLDGVYTLREPEVSSRVVFWQLK